MMKWMAGWMECDGKDACKAVNARMGFRVSGV